MSQISDIIDTPMRNLTNVNRYAGILLIKSESVSDHVWEMIALALNIVPDVNKILDKKIDIKEVIYKIAVHDLDECLSFDIPRPFKYDNEEITRAIKNTNESIMRRVFPSELIEDINNSKDESMEGYLVKILDGLQAGLKMRQEILIGNTFIKSEIPNITNLLRIYCNQLHTSMDSFEYNYKQFMIKLMESSIYELEKLLEDD